MKTRRLIGVAALGAAAASLLLVPSAGAQETDLSYGANASGQALSLKAFGQELTVGRTASGLDSTVSAVANGTGLATPAFEAGVSSAQVTGEGQDGSDQPTCEGALPQEIPGVSLDAACSSSLASVVDGLPHAVAAGGVADLTVNPVQPLLETPLTAIVEPVQEAVDQLVDGLRPITTAVDENTNLGLEDTVDTLFTSLFEGADLVKINLGQTVTDAVTGPDALSATCTAAGGRVDVLDPPATAAGVDPEPVLSVIVGSATTKVDVTTADAQATPTVDQAIVTVKAPSLGIDQPVEPGQTIEIPLPEPLGSSTISVADSRTGVDENGQTFAAADAVFLDLLNGEAMMGGVELSLANCTSVAGAAIQATPAAPEPTPALPRTGGGSPNGLAVAATLGFGALGLALVRRSRGDAV